VVSPKSWERFSLSPRERAGVRGNKSQNKFMPAKKTKVAATKSATPVQQRLWLMYPPKLIKKPFIYEVGHKFKVVTNIRQATISDEIGIVCLELDGKHSEVGKAITWLEKQGVNVEPVEIGVIAG